MYFLLIKKTTNSLNLQMTLTKFRIKSGSQRQRLTFPARHAWGTFHMDRAGLELKIGFGRLRASRDVLFAFSGKLRDLSGRSATQ
jgi:hypothetical protein